MTAPAQLAWQPVRDLDDLLLLEHVRWYGVQGTWGLCDATDRPGIWQDGVFWPIPPGTERLEVLRPVPSGEPQWQPGDVVRAQDGKVYVRDRRPGWLYGGARCRHEYPARPLVRLVPQLVVAA